MAGPSLPQMVQISHILQTPQILRADNQTGQQGTRPVTIARDPQMGHQLPEPSNLMADMQRFIMAAAQDALQIAQLPSKPSAQTSDTLQLGSQDVEEDHLSWQQLASQLQPEENPMNLLQQQNDLMPHADWEEMGLEEYDLDVDAQKHHRTAADNALSIVRQGQQVIPAHQKQ